MWSSSGPTDSCWPGSPTGSTTAGSPSTPGAGLAVVVRAGHPWPQPPAGVHIGLDVSLHHTVVLGPLVVPGVTACIACAEQRAVRRWGEPAIPPTPAVTRHVAAVADLLAIQVELMVAGTSPLVNATIAWDLEHGTCDRQSVYKLVGCSTCDVAPATGRVTLPWLAAEPAGHVVRAS